MAGQFGEMVPGENCFSLNFGSPTMNGSGGANDGPLGAGSAASSPMPVTPSSMLNDPKNRPLLPNGKKTKGRVKIRMEFIDNKLRRYTTFSKRKTGIMKKAYELSTLTGTQVMLLVASETGHVYTFATKKLQPMITSEAGKALIQTCLNSPDGGNDGSSPSHDSMSAMTNFHTSEIAPSGLMNISTTGSSVATSNGGGSSRKKARSSQHSLTFSLNETLQAKNNSKSYYANDLPTMVQPTSIFSSGSSAGLRSSDDDEDEIEEDEDGGMTPSPTSPLVVDHVMTSSASNVTPSGGVNSSHHHHQQAMAGILQAAMCNGGSSGKSSKQQQQHSGMPSSVGGSPLFPFASFIPASSASQNQPAFGFLPGMNGAFMYQMPQGLVIPTMPFGDGTSGGQQNIMIANAGDGNGQTGQQQFITIPVPMALTQQMLASQILGNMATDGSLKKTKTEDEESD